MNPSGPNFCERFGLLSELDSQVLEATLEQLSKSMGYCARFGAISEQDAQVLEATLDALPKKIKFLEIGIHDGNTGRGVKRWCDDHGVELDWWGIDVCHHEPPFPGATFIKGDSAEVYVDVPNDFNGILIDGCHCRNHIILDTYNYAPKVLLGGYLLFHDTGPNCQGNDHQAYHGSKAVPEFHIATLDAFKMIGWPHPGWSLFMEKADLTLPFGGMHSYYRLPRWTPTAEETEHMAQ